MTASWTITRASLYRRSKAAVKPANRTCESKHPCDPAQRRNAGYTANGKLLLEDAVNATLSPEGNFLAYASSTSGRNEVWVQAFPITGTAWKYQVSTEGADSPLWSRDGTELFYLSLGERRIYSVPVFTKPAFRKGKPMPLPIQGILAPGPRNYDITHDGKSFVTVFPRSQANGGDKAPFERINVTLNCFEELKQRVPVH